MKLTIALYTACLIALCGIFACGGGSGGNSSPSSNPPDTTADTTAPTVPTGLMTSPSGTNTINISWSASSDNVAVTGYKIHRFGAVFANSLSSTYTNTGLDAGTNYCYTVSAYDAAGNESAQSGQDCTTTNAALPASCWNTKTVDGSGLVQSVGTSLIVDSNGNPKIGYITSDGSLNIAVSNNQGQTWQVMPTFVNDAVSYPSMAADAGTNVFFAGYMSSGYDSCITHAALGTSYGGYGCYQTADSDGWWTTIAVDSLGGVHTAFLDIAVGDLIYYKYGSSSVTVDSAGYVGTGAKLKVDSNNKVHIAYQADYNALKYATNSSGSWVVSTIDTNLGALGLDLRIDSSNKAHIVYNAHVGTGSNIKYATNKSGTWAISTVSVGDYSYPAVALDANDYLHVLYTAPVNTTNYILKYGTNKSGAWQTESIEDIGHLSGIWPSIAIDTNNRIHVSHMDFTDYSLRYAAKDIGTSCSNVDPGGLGDLSFTLTWTWSGSSRTEGPDIDLWVTDPHGDQLTTSRDGYGLGPCPDGGQIDYDDLGGWGDGDGGGPERAFWPTESAPSGTYSYGVRYYQGDGTATYTLKVYKGTTVFATKTGTLTTTGDYITIGNVTK